MKQCQIESKSSDKFFELSVSHLKDLYLGTVAELKECADYVEDSDNDEMLCDMREAVLLDFEARIIDQAVKAPLESPEDVKTLVEFWRKLTGVNTRAEVSNSDLLVQNIFRHLFG